MRAGNASACSIRPGLRKNCTIGRARPGRSTGGVRRRRARRRAERSTQRVRLSLGHHDVRREVAGSRARDVALPARAQQTRRHVPPAPEETLDGTTSRVARRETRSSAPRQPRGRRRRTGTAAGHAAAAESTAQLHLEPRRPLAGQRQVVARAPAFAVRGRARRRRSAYPTFRRSDSAPRGERRRPDAARHVGLPGRAERAGAATATRTRGRSSSVRTTKSSRTRTADLSRRASTRGTSPLGSGAPDGEHSSRPAALHAPSCS